MRSFVAIPIAEESLEALLRLQAMIPVGRPVPEDNLHLTLAFLDDVETPVLEDLDMGLSGLRTAPVAVRFTGLDSFTEMERGLVFAGVDKTPELEALQGSVARAARSVGIDLPRRRFRPHVTLTRARRKPDSVARDRLAALIGAHRDAVPGFLAQEFCLYHSELHPSGARHEVLARYPLGG